jgi:hypothetical protein
LQSGNPGPLRKQLDLAARFASAAINVNAGVTLEFKPSISPWTYYWMVEALGADFVKGFAGPKLRARDVKSRTPSR